MVDFIFESTLFDKLFITMLQTLKYTTSRKGNLTLADSSNVNSIPGKLVFGIWWKKLT